VAVALFAFAPGQARAATNVYPAGAGTFTGGPQGWLTTDASCSIAGLCSAEGGYDAADGNPPGSYAANTTIDLSVAMLFKATITVQSPDFTIATGGDGTLHLDRQFGPGALVDLAPEATYTVDLLDRSAGSQTEVLAETITAASPFTGKDQAVTVKAGHTYALSIKTDISSTVAGSGLLGEPTSVRFDNVALSVEPGGGGGGGGGSGSGSGSGGTLTNQQLQSLISGNGSLVGPAILKGKRIFVRAKCPVKVGRACKISVRGLLKKRKPATSTRTAKVGKGKTKRFVLQVKPKARGKVRAKKKLLFKETVRAGKARATVYRRLKLIKR
jgi:hypothetical protein